MREGLENFEGQKGWNVKRFDYFRESDEILAGLEADDDIIDMEVSIEERMEYLERRKEFVKTLLERWKKSQRKK